MENKSFKESIWALDPNGLNDSARHVQGRAKFESGKGITISLPFGSLLFRVPDSNGVVHHSVDNVPTADVIYGFSQDGYAQTVVDVFDAGSGLAIPGATFQTLHGSEMYVTRSTEPIPSNPAITSFSMRLAGLREWVGRSPLHETYRYDEANALKEHVLSYSPTGAPEIVLHDDCRVRVVLNHTYTIKGGKYPTAHFEHSVGSDYSLVFSFSHGVLLNDAFEKWVLPVRNFLSFCMGFLAPVRSLCFTTDDGRHADYYVPMIEGTEPGDSRLGVMPLSQGRCGEAVQSMLKSWLGFSARAKDASLRAVSLLRASNLPIDTLFLATAQAFEAITREGKSPYVLDTEIHRERMRDVANRLVDSNHRNWVIDRLARSNIKSANDFAREQMEGLGEFAAYVVPDSETYLKEHRATRNYYSHLEGSGNKRRLEPGEKMLANQNATFLLLYGSICLLLGLTPGEILEAIKSSRFMGHQVYRTRKHYSQLEG